MLVERWSDKELSENQDSGNCEMSLPAAIEEQYWDYLRRTANEVDYHLDSANIESWVIQQRRRYSWCLV